MTEETITVWFIQNDWDHRLLCSLDWVWINDGRSTAFFETEEKAREAREYYLEKHPDEKGRLWIEPEIVHI